MIQVKCFEADHELDLEEEVNEFLEELDESQLISVHYSSSHFADQQNQIFSFSACLVYRIKPTDSGRLVSGRKLR